MAMEPVMIQIKSSPQGLMLEPVLWNIFYDIVLDVEMPEMKN